MIASSATKDTIEQQRGVDFHVIFPTGEIDSIEPTLDEDKHCRQIDLLIRLLEYYWRDRNDFRAISPFITLPTNRNPLMLEDSISLRF